MNLETIFTVKNEHLDLLNERTAVEFFQKLLWAEARRIGIEISKINVSSQLNVPDGGIDATVDEAPISTSCGIIKPGKTSYQIKAGAAFKPWRKKSAIKKELFGAKEPERKNLGRSIRDCLEVCGTYVLVCTGIDLVECQRIDALHHIKDYLKQCDYPDAKVEVWSQNTLRCFLKMFPSLALWVTGHSSAQFQTHQSWSQNANMRVPFVPGQSQAELIKKIQNELRGEDDMVHVSVAGQPGIGKTRLVLETTKEKDLSPLVIYCPADQFLQDKFLMDELCKDENQFSAVVVIDDCNLHNRSEILDKLRHRGPRIKLVTIYNNHEEMAGDITPYVPQPLGDDQIRCIIQAYTNTSETINNRWVALCSGSPRVAHVVGWNLVNYPKNLLTPLRTVNIWERYIVSIDDPSNEKTEQRRRVLRYIALFKQFGFEVPLGDEAKDIAKKIEAADPQITWTIFQEIIDNLKKRKILQGDFTFSIEPKALHIKLWTEWWDIYGRDFDLEEFAQGLTQKKLVDWFYEMFQYATESGIASRVVEDLLDRNGPFQKGDYLHTTPGGHFFLVLTTAAPKFALKCLQETIESWDSEVLSRFTADWSVVRALEKIAMQAELFADAARLLLILGEEKFAELFSPGWDIVAPTSASPAERFPILKEAFESGSKEQRALALQACDAALQSGHFSRIGSADYQGLRPEPKLWIPETYGELWDAYKQVWQLLFEQLEHLPEDEREEGVTILLEHAGELGRISDLGDMVVEIVESIAQKRYVDEKQFIEAISQILYYDEPYGENGLPAEIRQRLEKLREDLVGSDFHSVMQRYIGMDLLEDKFDENGNHVDQAQPQIEKLAQQVVDNPSLLRPELGWLVTAEAKKGYHFGHELGTRDDGFALLPILLDAQRNAGEDASVSFLCGYFHAISKIDVKYWEEQFGALGDDSRLNVAIPELMRYSELTDRAGWQLLNLARNGIIGINYFEIFVYRKAIENLSDKVFTEWISFLLNVIEKSAVSIALHLYHCYYIDSKSEATLPCNLTFRLLSHPSLFEERDLQRSNSMTHYYWKEIGKVFLHRCPEKSLELAELMLSHFGHDGSIFGVYSQTCSVLDQITEQLREEVWEQISKHLEDQTDFSRKGSLERWLREGSSSAKKQRKGALTLIPPEKIWEWVDKDIEKRAWYLASRLVPKTLSVVGWRDSLVRAILIRYGEREEVRSSLRSNYLTEGWHGPGSLHYKEKQQQLLRLKQEEDNENVKQWIDEFVNGLEDAIKHEKMEEERRF